MHALELYAQAFDQAGALAKLEGFASLFGPAFYQLPVNTTRISLQRTAWRLPEQLPLADSVIVPLNAGETLQWKMVG
jgi:dihydroorotase